MSDRIHRLFRQWALAGCMLLALSGCGGGSVSVRSSFAGAPAPLASGAPAPTGPPGLRAHYGGSGNFGLAILGIVIVADLVQWTSAMIKQAFAAEGSAAAERMGHGTILPTPRKCVYPVPEMC